MFGVFVCVCVLLVVFFFLCCGWCVWFGSGVVCGCVCWLVVLWLFGVCVGWVFVWCCGVVFVLFCCVWLCGVGGVVVGVCGW